jgi:hypothetical protein
MRVDLEGAISFNELKNQLSFNQTTSPWWVKYKHNTPVLLVLKIAF